MKRLTASITTGLLFVLIAAGHPATTHGQDKDREVTPEQWEEAFVSVRRAVQETVLEHESGGSVDQQRALVTALVDFLEEDVMTREKKDSVPDYSDIGALIAVRQAQALCLLPEWIFVDVVVRRLEDEKGEADPDLLRLLKAVLIGAGALRTERDWADLFHRYSDILEYLETTETDPADLPRPLVGWMMQYDPHAAVITLSRAAGDAWDVLSAVGVVGSAQHALHFDEIDENRADVPEVDGSVNVLANHEAWYVRLYLATIMKESDELAERVDPAILDLLANDEAEGVREQAKAIPETSN